MADEAKKDAPKPQNSKPSPLFAIFVIAIVGGIYYFNHQPGPNATPPESVVDGNKTPEPQQPELPTQIMPMATMTIATWDLTPLNFEKLADSNRAQRISEIISQFDLIAVQGVVRTTQPLDEIVRRINTKGKKYAYAIPKNIGIAPEYVAFLFNTEVVKYDPEKTYDIIESSLSYRPLVVSFCTVQPQPEKAFTFHLVNIKIPDPRKDVETRVLGEVFRQARDRAARETPSEDDVIMLGNFGLPVMQIDSLLRVPYLTAVHTDLPTTIDEMDSTENIVFDNKRTTECIGIVKRLDLIKLYDLNLSEASAIAGHFPLCAEFSVYESLSPLTTAGLASQ